MPAASFVAASLLAVAFSVAHWHRGAVHRHHIDEVRLLLGAVTQVRTCGCVWGGAGCTAGPPPTYALSPASRAGQLAYALSLRPGPFSLPAGVPETRKLAPWAVLWACAGHRQLR